MQEDKHFTDNREALLEPVREQAERLRKDLESVNLEILRGRDKVVYKAKEGLLTGLDKDGCLESVEQKCLCGSCAKILISGEIPQAALINGTWPGLVPEELGTLSPIELSMIGIYNSITVLTMLPSGESTIVPISKKYF